MINLNNLKKIKNINKWNNKKIKLMDHLMNFSAIYVKIININNKYLKLSLIQSKKNFKKI